METISICYGVKQKLEGTFRAFFLFFRKQLKLPEDGLQMKSERFEDFSGYCYAKWKVFFIFILLRLFGKITVYLI